MNGTVYGLERTRMCWLGLGAKVFRVGKASGAGSQGMRSLGPSAFVEPTQSFEISVLHPSGSGRQVNYENT